MTYCRICNGFGQDASFQDCSNCGGIGKVNDPIEATLEELETMSLEEYNEWWRRINWGSGPRTSPLSYCPAAKAVVNPWDDD